MVVVVLVVVVVVDGVVVMVVTDLVVAFVVNGAVVVVALPCHFLRFSEDKRMLPATLVITRENPISLTFSHFGRIPCCCW